MIKFFDIPVFFGISIEVYFFLIVLAFPTFFIWNWLFKKFIKNYRVRKVATWTATIFATPSIYVGLILLWVFSISYYPTHNFDKEKWLADKEKRYEYSENIIESKLLIGMTKIEVRQLLGDEGNKNDSDYWNYYLGFKPAIGNIDPDDLDIEFKDGKIVKVRQHNT